MICKPCVARYHFRCSYPASCSCAHKTTWPDGGIDEWSYTPIPLVMDNGSYQWVWDVTHPEQESMLFDDRGRRCFLRFGKRGARLFYRAVDFEPYA